MTVYRYIFDKSNKKHSCPDCGKKRFVRYVDSSNGKYLPEQYGRCDREVNCAYHLNPYQNGYSKMIWEQEKGQYSGQWKPAKQTPKPKLVEKPISFIPLEVLQKTRQGWNRNIFIQNLLQRFALKDIEKIISIYQLGTVCKGYRTGGITFPFIDIKGNIRAIQVKQFDPTNHTISTDFLHSIIEKHHKERNKPFPDWLEYYLQNDIKVSCLFGEHLLSKYPYNTVALVEAPKTAILGTLYNGFPDTLGKMLWLAVYNLSSLTIEKCKVLNGRTVTLFPDLSKPGAKVNCFEKWSDKAKELNRMLNGTKFIVSDLLERHATDDERKQGLDIADFLIRFNYRDFILSEPKQESQTAQTLVEDPKMLTVEITQSVQPEIEQQGVSISQPAQDVTCSALLCSNNPNDEVAICQNSEDWKNEISELETYFEGTTIPAVPIKLNACTTIVDIPKFIHSHLACVKTNNGNRTFLPYLERLRELQQYLKIITK